MSRSPASPPRGTLCADCRARPAAVFDASGVPACLRCQIAAEADEYLQTAVQR